jgi:AcrR family transcriptional regulator
MNSKKRQMKESNILEAAESVFSELGFKNAKMEDIARKAGITKVTLYSYYQSKENLYLALTYKALQLLIDRFYTVIDEHKNKTGLESVLAILEAFMDFCETHFLYSELLLEYFAIVRSSSDGANNLKLTEAVKDSIYFVKLQDMHNLPYKLTAKEIEKGKKDGSIITSLDAMLCTLHGWTMVIGYVKVLRASGNAVVPLFNTSIRELKALNLKMASHMFTTATND